MVTSSKSAEDQLAALRAELAGQQALNKKMQGQLKDKDGRIRTLEAELEAMRAASSVLPSPLPPPPPSVRHAWLRVPADGAAAQAAALEAATARANAMEAQAAAESAARAQAIEESKQAAARAELLQREVDVLNRRAEDAARKLR